MERITAIASIQQSHRSGAARITASGRLVSERTLHDAVMRAQGGDERACRAVVEHACQFADMIAQEVYLSWASRLPAAASYDDAFQCALMGLMRAVDKFELGRGSTFLHYAAFWIKQSVQRGFVYPMLSSWKVSREIVGDRQAPEHLLTIGTSSIDVLAEGLDDSWQPRARIDHESLDTLDARELIRELNDAAPGLGDLGRSMAEGRVAKHASSDIGISELAGRRLLKGAEGLREQFLL